MRVLLQLLTCLLSSGRTNAAERRISSEDYLKPLLILLIALVAGPDIFAAVELTTLLELLGVALFLLSFSVGFRLAGLTVLEAMRLLLLPVQYVALVRRGRSTARVHGLLLIGRHNLPLFCLAVSGIAVLVQFVR